jgi:UDP-glucuronate decarboxylase
MTPSHYNYDIRLDAKRSVQLSRINIEILRGKTIFITGGTGFFGVWLLNILLFIKHQLNDDLRLIVLSRNPEKFLQDYVQYDFRSNVEFIIGDVKNFQLTENMIVTHLIHMATTSAIETFEGEDQLNKLDTLYIGTRNVLEQCGLSLEKVLFTSSGVAYGVNRNDFISEADLTGHDVKQIGSALGVGKIVAELLVAYYAKNFNYTYSIARCFSFAGQHLPLNLHYAFGNFIHNAIFDEDIVINGDGQDIRSYLYIGDAMAWILRLFTEPHNQTYNVGSQAPIKIEELATKIKKKSNSSINVSIQKKYYETGNFHRQSYVPSVSKIIKDYPGLSEWTHLDLIIDKMLSIKAVE